ncbi:MAG: type II secretion system protein GspE [Cyanobacteria bacterium SIG31]|nr:type II secretion system protein GspE [Cyanobacteria bacterium SIG31]
MSNQLEKLKNSIKKEYTKNFELNLMKTSGFIPVDKRQEDVFVIINKKNLADKSKIEVLIKDKFSGYAPKFIPVEHNDFEDLFSFISNAESVSSASSNDVEPKELSAEEMLVSIGWITEEQLVESQKEAQEKQLPLDAIFYGKGYLTYERIVSYLKKKFGCEVISKSNIVVDNAILKLLPDDFIAKKRTIIMSMEDNKLAVAMVNPEDKYTIREISLSTGRPLNVYAIPYFEYEMYLKEYELIKKSEQHAKETERIIQSIEEEAAEYNQEETLWVQVEKELQDASGNVAKFVYKIITDAIDAKASDIHIEPRLGYYVVRLRSDGILKKVLEIPGSIEQAVITRFKVLARMNIAEHRRPQDGTFSIKYNDRMYDFRINTLPVSGKEKVVIRILAPAVSLKTSGEKMIIQGASDEDLEKIHDMVQCPNGIILTSGPTGSGKTTTLYTILKALNNEDVNITTIEDPIEIKLEGINQSQVNPKADITFASCMRAILRQDPDIILIGEIRDFETLEVAISAALTGHLVLSTVHTNSAAATVTRLIEMGAKDYLVSSTLTGVIAQRLVRKLCDHCKEAYFPTEEETKHISNNPEIQQQLLKTKLYRKKGCKECGYLGYTGRIGIYEVMPITREIKKLIAQGAHDIEIEEAAVAAGMKTLKFSCLDHIIQGNTTSSEFIRVLGYANE